MDTNNCQRITRNIRKPGGVGDFNFCTFIQNHNGLISMSSEISASAYYHPFSRHRLRLVGRTGGGLHPAFYSSPNGDIVEHRICEITRDSGYSPPPPNPPKPPSLFGKKHQIFKKSKSMKLVF